MTSIKPPALLRQYVLGTWFLKIRLQSVRRVLFGSEFSVIHLEQAAIQFRKMVEMMSYLCLTSASMNGFEIQKRQMKNYRAGEVFNYLGQLGADQLPFFSRLSKRSEDDEDRTWDMKLERFKLEEVDRLRNIHNQTNSILHEYSPFDQLGSPELVATVLTASLRSMQIDHQWLWNRFWQHAFFVRQTLVHIDLGDPNNNGQPILMQAEGLTDADFELNFDPNLVSDFTGEIKWSDFDCVVPRPQQS